MNRKIYCPEDGYVVSFVAVWLGYRLALRSDPIFLAATVAFFLSVSFLMAPLGYFLVRREFSAPTVVLPVVAAYAVSELRHFLTAEDWVFLSVILCSWVLFAILETCTRDWFLPLIRDKRSGKDVTG